VLQDSLDEALLFRTIATLQPDAPVSASMEDMEWQGPQDGFADVAASVDGDRLADRAARLARG